MRRVSPRRPLDVWPCCWLIRYLFSVVGDEAAELVLARVVRDWFGVLDVLQELAGRVWRTNLDRYEPSRLGDDATSLGITSSRNLCNLAVREFEDVPGVVARDRNTLEVCYGGRMLHTSKAPSSSPTWDVQSISWITSEVRSDGAAANTAAYVSRAGTLFEDATVSAAQGVGPDGLRHLHLVWQGLEDGTTRSWVGFPCAGVQPWFVVRLLEERAGAAATVGVDRGGSPGPGPDFDALGEPLVAVTRRLAGQTRQLPHSA